MVDAQTQTQTPAMRKIQAALQYDAQTGCREKHTVPESLGQMSKEQLHGNLIQEEPPNSCNIAATCQRNKINCLNNTTPTSDSCDNDLTDSKNLEVMDNIRQLLPKKWQDDRMQLAGTDRTHQSHADRVGKNIPADDQDLQQNTLTTDEENSAQPQHPELEQMSGKYTTKQLEEINDFRQQIATNTTGGDKNHRYTPWEQQFSTHQDAPRTSQLEQVTLTGEQKPAVFEDILNKAKTPTTTFKNPKLQPPI
jgi:hypothetical protein